jgi:malonate-semialdehyde dehydrogenase (acetylating) / methylmalonate-semialdehyde dehydrogenase
MNEAVENAKDTFRTWSKTTILQRQQIMFRYQDLVRKNMVRSNNIDCRDY